MTISRSFIRGVRFLFVSAAIIVIGMTICNIYDINITEDLQQEIKNINAYEQVLSYYTLFNDKILKNVNISSLPFLYSQSSSDSQGASFALMVDVLTINLIFSELYGRLSGYNKKLYSIPVRAIFTFVGALSEFELTYCSHAFLVFLSFILPNNFGSLPFFTRKFDYAPGDYKAHAMSWIIIYLSIFCLFIFLCIVLVTCFPHFVAISFVCIVALVVLYFNPNFNLFGLPFIILGLIIRWLLGNADFCAALREGLLQFLVPYAKRVALVIGVCILIYAIAYFFV